MPTKHKTKVDSLAMAILRKRGWYVCRGMEGRRVDHYLFGANKDVVQKITREELLFLSQKVEGGDPLTEQQAEQLEVL